MKSGTLLGVAIALAAGGYFGYDWWKEKKAKEKVEAERNKQLEAMHQGADVDAGTPNGPILVPDLTGLTPDEAKAKLSKLGFKIDNFKVLEHHACSYVKETDMKKRGQICAQDPPVGANSAAGRKFEVTIEEDDYEAGGIGTVTEWKRMPELEGLSLQAAQSKLTGLGFREEEFQIEREQGCGTVGMVCRTEPAGLGRKVRGRTGTLFVGE